MKNLLALALVALSVLSTTSRLNAQAVDVALSNEVVLVGTVILLSGAESDDPNDWRFAVRSAQKTTEVNFIHNYLLSSAQMAVAAKHKVKITGAPAVEDGRAIVIARTVTIIK